MSFLALGYGRKKRLREKRQNANCVEDAWTEIGAKWPKKKKRWSKVRESESLDERIKENRSTRKMDRGKLNKRKKPLLDALEHLVGRMERQAGKAWKTWVKLT
jgi:hypothetical protein